MATFYVYICCLNKAVSNSEYTVASYRRVYWEGGEKERLWPNSSYLACILSIWAEENHKYTQQAYSACWLIF
jgi:hypothetical protein